MAIISETELQRRLRKAIGNGGSQGPTATRVGSTWEYTEPVLYLAYVDSLDNLSTAGTIALQSEAHGFSFSPFNATGSIKPYRGFLFSKSMYASGDPTDYVWEDVTTFNASITYDRKYTTSSKLASHLGDPDNVVSGVTWISLVAGSAVPADAFWVAEQYTFNNVKSMWVVFPVKSKDVGTPLAVYEIPSRNMPALDSVQWSLDTLVAMGSHTGETYSSVREFGYGTAVVILYADGYQRGLYKKNGIVDPLDSSQYLDGWVAPTAFVDGDFLVNGTINTDKIMANTILGDKINSATTITAGTGNNVGVLDGADATYRIYAGHATPALAPFRVKQDGTVIIDHSNGAGRLILEGDVIKVYTTSGGVDTLRVKLGNLA